MEKIDNLPIYQKAMSICTLVESISKAFPENDVFLQQTKHLMLEDAIIIPSKIAGAESGELYSIRMQNAALIRYHALHLFLQIGTIRLHSTFKDIEYITLLRVELDEFRIMFVNWVASFDTENYIWDDWGLFNPPNADPDHQHEDFDMDDLSENSY